MDIKSLRHQHVFRDLTRDRQIIVDEVCDEFEAAWNAGQRPRIESYLNEYQRVLRDELLKELLLTEWELRERAGEVVEIEPYVRRFPKNETWLNVSFRGFYETNLQLSVDNSCSTFDLSVPCPTCHVVMEFVVDSSLSKVNCPACDSQLSVNDIDAATPVDFGKLGRFELVERLGVGTFGAVFKARDTQLHRTVALKIPRNTHLDNDEIDRFLREARIAAQLRHPNILNVHEVGRHKDTIYIVSDVICGVPLSEWLAQRSVTAQEAAKLCTKLADALHHAHQAGVIHRDVKPQNVMLDSADEPYLMDFGLARRDVGEVTMTFQGDILGTPAYMAPEQARGEAHQADCRTDLYSLGVILFELLTGERPFRGTPQIILHRLLNDDPPRPRKLNSHIPRDLETICLKCLAKRPNERYASARHVKDDLQRYLEGRPIHARPISPVARFARTCRRNPVLSSLCAVAITLTLILAVGGPIVAIQQSRLADANRRQLYSANMEMAMEAYVRGELDLVDSVLAQHDQSELRRFEWYYLRQRLNAANRGRVIGFTGPIGDIAVVSPRKLAVVHGPTVSVVDAVSAQATPLVSLDLDCNSVSVSPNDPETIAVCSKDGSVRLHRASDASTELLAKYAQQDGMPARTAFSPDGGKIAVAVWQDATGDWIDIWDLKRRDCRKIQPPSLSAIDDICYSSNGRKLAWADFIGKQVCFWDADTERIESLPMSAGPKTVCFLPNEERIVCGCADGRLVIWNLESGVLEASTKAHTLRVMYMDLSPDGQTLVTGGDDNRIKAWSIAENRFRLLDDYNAYSRPTTVRLYESMVISGDAQGRLHLWNLNDGMDREVLRGHTNIVRCVDISPNGRLVASGGVDQTLRIWNLDSGDAQVYHEHSASVRGLSFSPDGKLIATAGWDKKVILWSVGDRKETRILKCDVPVWNVEFSRDGKYVTGTGWNTAGEQLRTSTMWEVDSGRRVESPKHDAIASESFGSQYSPSVSQRILATSRDGKWQVRRDDDTVGLYDAGRDKMLWSMPFRRQMDWVFFHNGRTLAYCEDDVIRLLDLPTGRRRATLRGHQHRIWDIAVSTDGQTLVSASEDETVRIWQAHTNVD